MIVKDFNKPSLLDLHRSLMIQMLNDRLRFKQSAQVQFCSTDGHDKRFQDAIEVLQREQQVRGRK